MQTKVLTRVLYDIQQQYPVCLASFEGGVKHNAIPSKAVAVLSVRAEDVAAIKTLIAYQEKQYLHEYGIQDPGLKFVVEDVATPDVVYADDTTEALITYIYLAQDGVHSVSKSIPNLVETSDNIAIVRENEHTIGSTHLDS